MNVVLLEDQDIGQNDLVTLTDHRAAHVVNVLRVAVGSTVRVGRLDGPLGRGLVTELGASSVTLSCTFDDTVPARPAVDLLLALPRPKVLRRLWPHLAACGVGQVMLTNASKVERDYFDSHYVRVEGFRPLLIEGLQQAVDTRVPVVSVHKQFRKLVEDGLGEASDGGVRLVAHPGPRSGIRETLAPRQGERVLLAVGPEGGWNDFELELLHMHGFTQVGMGPRVLTTTTACIALLTLVHDAIR